MNATNLRTKTDDELSDLLATLRKEMFNLRFQRASGQLAGTSRVRAARREIARIMTLIGERSRAGKAS
mgnify:CR=1 FL=1